MAFPPEPTATPSPPGRGRSVLLLITGGIAAYKACIVVRGLVDAGCDVRVAMTSAATRFVTPLTFEALSGQPVGTSLWGEGGEQPLDHIQWARAADLTLVAPATADFLAKIAHGLADDLPSTLVSAASSPIVVAPAMNDRMWESPANQANLATLRARGVDIVDPGTGFLACGTIAEGRLAEPAAIVQHVLERLAPGPLSGARILVTGGPTHEPLDAVRYLGNRSSGRMGIALAEAARDLGAQVTLLLGPTELAPPTAVRVVRFTTAAQLLELARREAKVADAIAMAAAVADFRPAVASTGKLKKQDGVPAVQLERTEDVLADLAASKPVGQFLIGFALEAGGDAQVEQQARAKLAGKGLDLVCGNRADVEGEGFEASGNRVFLIGRNGRAEWTQPAAKSTIARTIWQRAIETARASSQSAPTDAAGAISSEGAGPARRARS